MNRQENLADLIDCLSDGAVIYAYLDPLLYQPCLAQFKLLGLAATPQWVRVRLRKVGTMYASMVLAEDLEPLPILRTYRRSATHGCSGHYKRAFFYYVKRVSNVDLSTERGA